MPKPDKPVEPSTDERLLQAVEKIGENLGDIAEALRDLAAAWREVDLS